MNAVGGLAQMTVQEVAGESRAVIERLAQLERHDLSEFRGGRCPMPTGCMRPCAARESGTGQRLSCSGSASGKWGIAFQEENPGAARFWRRVATNAVGPAWVEEPRPVPGQPDLPPDIWIFLDSNPWVGSVR